VAEIIGEFDRVAQFIAELEIDRNVGIEMLLDTNKFEANWLLTGGRTHDATHHWTAHTLRKQWNWDEREY
jgi:hypothetical protein